jgi:hypothetical protein
MAPPNRGPIVSKPVSGDYDSVFLLLYALRNPYQQFIWRDFNKETKKKKKSSHGHSVPETRLETRSFLALAVTIVL